MGIESVADGVENESQAAELTTLGCQIGQGFYFSPPLCPERFDELLARQDSTSRAMA